MESVLTVVTFIPDQSQKVTTVSSTFSTVSKKWPLQLQKENQQGPKTRMLDPVTFSAVSRKIDSLTTLL